MARGTKFRSDLKTRRGIPKSDFVRTQVDSRSLPQALIGMQSELLAPVSPILRASPSDIRAMLAGTGGVTAAAEEEVPFTPASLTNLNSWYDDTTLTVDGSNNVSAWADKTDNGYDWTTITSSFATSLVNSLRVPEFAFTKQMERVTGFAHFNNGGNLPAFTVGAVFNPTTAADACLFDLINSDSNYNLRWVIRYNNTAFVQARVAGTFDTVTLRNYTGLLSTGTTYLMIIRYDGTDTWTESFDGDRASHTNAIGTLNDTVTGIQIPDDVAWLRAGLCEWLLVDGAITDEEMTNLETYWADKWGITLAA